MKKTKCSDNGMNAERFKFIIDGLEKNGYTNFYSYTTKSQIYITKHEKGYQLAMPDKISHLPYTYELSPLLMNYLVRDRITLSELLFIVPPGVFPLVLAWLI